MGELMEGVNWLGVIAGTVVSFLAGWLWYSPKLFGTKWAEGSRVQLGNANEMPVGAMIAQVIGLFLMSWLVGVTMANNEVWTAILATLAFAILAYSGSMFSQKTAYARVVDFGYWIAALVIMVVCQALFLGMAG
jgi:high-affinity Fe2+/Pb2+ permease